MIDAKKIEELISKRTELEADAKVCHTIGDFIISNKKRCWSERNYSEWWAWRDALDEATSRLSTINSELAEILEQLEQMG